MLLLPYHCLFCCRLAVLPLPPSQAKFVPPPLLPQLLLSRCCCRLITIQSSAAAVDFILSLPSLPIPVRASAVAASAVLLLTFLLSSYFTISPLPPSQAKPSLCLRRHCRHICHLTATAISSRRYSHAKYTPPAAAASISISVESSLHRHRHCYCCHIIAAFAAV